MPRARVRGGRKAHNKRIKKRREIMEHIDYLRKKIIEEAKERYYKQSGDTTDTKWNTTL